MSRVERPYVRVYYEDLQRDYPDVFFHRTAFGTYVRLLVLAAQAYPSDPVLPVESRRDLELLERRTLLERINGRQFRIKGYLPERTARAEHAKKGAEARHA